MFFFVVWKKYICLLVISVSMLLLSYWCESDNQKPENAFFSKAQLTVRISVYV